MDKLIDLINQGGTGEYDARQERGEAVFYYRPRSDGRYEGPLHRSVIEPVRRNSEAWVPLYTHPTPDAGRVAELEAECKRLREEVHAHASNEVDFAEQIAALEAQLAESREREGRMREALAERLKNAEQAAFEAWFYKECPSGDAAAVQDKWLESDARADALDGWATAEAALAAEKEGE